MGIETSDPNRQGSESTPGVNPGTRPSLSDLRGAAQIVTDATVNTTRLVEAVHASVGSTLSLRPARPKTRGLTGWIYRCIRHVMHLTGRGLETGLQVAEHVAPSRTSSDGNGRRAMQAVLNGIVGDHLSDSGNPLALPFSLRNVNGTLFEREHTLDGETNGIQPSPNGFVVFVHGLCCSDRSWTTTVDGVSKGLEKKGHVGAIPRVTGGRPLLARYNTGRPIRENSRLLSRHMASLVAGRDEPPRIVFVAHSMGGLVVRQALRHAHRTSSTWPEGVTETIFLGTPHQGAPLERIGAWVEDRLRQTRWTAPFAALTSLRSQGIQDLHDGLPDPDGREPCARGPYASHSPADNPPRDLPGRQFYGAAVVGTRASSHKGVGDGLVPVESALDACRGSERRIDTATRKVFENQGHFALLHAPIVTKAICEWLRRPQ